MTALFGDPGGLLGDPGSTFGDIAAVPTFPQIKVELSLDAPPLAESPNLWTDITGRCLSFTTNAGRGTQSDLFPSATASIVVDNSDRAFDVDNTDGPFVGRLTFNRRVRVTATWQGTRYPIYDGFLDEWGPLDYATTGGYNDLALPATDAFKFLTQMAIEAARPFTVADPVLGQLDNPLVRIAGAPSYPVQRSGTRVAQVLDLIGWPASRRAIDVGQTFLIADRPAGDVLTYLQRIERSEYGKLFVGPDGTLNFQERRGWLSRPAQRAPQGLFTDNPAALDGEYVKLVLSPTGITRIRNIVRRARQDGAGRQARDLTSIDAYGPVTDEQTDLLNESVEDLASQCAYVLSQFKDARNRIDGLVVDAHANPATLYPQVLGRLIGDRVQVARTPLDDGVTVTRDCWIDAVGHTVDASTQSWSTTWALVQAEENRYFTIGDPVLGKLDSVAVIAY